MNTVESIVGDVLHGVVKNVTGRSGGQSWSSYVNTQIASFRTTLQDESIWDKLDVVNLGFSGDSAYLNLKDDSVVASLADDTTYLEDKVGFFGEGITSYVLYNWVPSSIGNKYSLNSAYFGVYCWENIGEIGIVVGCIGSGGTLGITLNRLDNNSFRFNINCTTTKSITNTTGKSDGYFSLSKNNNAVCVSRNAVKIIDTTVTTTSVPDIPVVGLATQNSTIRGSFSLNKLGAVIAGEYLSEAENLILSDALSLLISQIAERPVFYDSGSVRYSIEGFGNKTIVGVDQSFRFAVSAGYVWMSVDSGVTWTSKAVTGASIENVNFAKFWDTGTVSFCVGTVMYRSTDALSNITVITPVDLNNDEYVIHTPANASYPGLYYRLLPHYRKMYRDGVEIFGWGNYGNVYGGAAPSNIYELTNDGANLKVIYQFGQNPYYKDDGTTDGGSTGTLLGDAGNAEIARHVHSVIWDETNLTYYIVTGDHDHGGTEEEWESRWMKIVYSEGTYTPTIIAKGLGGSNYQSTGFNLINGELYYNCEAEITAPVETIGVWKTTIANMATVGNHIQLLSSPAGPVSMVYDGTNLIVGLFNNYNILFISKDLGENWERIELDKLPGYPDHGAFMPMGDLDENGYQWYYKLFNSTTDNGIFKAKVI